MSKMEYSYIGKGIYILTRDSSLYRSDTQVCFLKVIGESNKILLREFCSKYIDVFSVTKDNFDICERSFLIKGILSEIEEHINSEEFKNHPAHILI